MSGTIKEKIGNKLTYMYMCAIELSPAQMKKIKKVYKKHIRIPIKHPSIPIKASVIHREPLLHV